MRRARRAIDDPTITKGGAHFAGYRKNKGPSPQPIWRGRHKSAGKFVLVPSNSFPYLRAQLVEFCANRKRLLFKRLGFDQQRYLAVALYSRGCDTFDDNRDQTRLGFEIRSDKCRVITVSIRKERDHRLSHPSCDRSQTHARNPQLDDVTLKNFSGLGSRGFRCWTAEGVAIQQGQKSHGNHQDARKFHLSPFVPLGRSLCPSQM